MRSPIGVLAGAQRPRVANVPPFVSSSGPEAVELAAEAGLVLDDWQAWVLEQGLGERADGSWASAEAALSIPRQNGKTEILVARALAGLFLLHEPLIVFTAHEFKAAAEAFLRCKAVVESHPDLLSQVRTIRTSHGEEGIELHSGERLRFLARSRSSARGFTCDCLILDEAFALTAPMMAAVISTGSAIPNRQIWYASMAGDQTAREWSRVRQRGHEGGGRLCWLEWSAEEGADLDDPEVWAGPNPGFPHRISLEAIELERAALGDEDFARERLGIPSVGQRERPIPHVAWRDVQDVDAAPAAGLRLGVDVLPDRSAGSIGVSDGTTVELIERRPGVAWIAERVAGIAQAHKAVVVVDATGPAVSLAAEIEAQRVSVERLSGPEVSHACARFVDAVLARRVAVRPHEVLSQAVATAVKRPVGDRFVWSRTASLTDVTPLVAVSLAYGTQAKPSEPRPASIRLPSRRVGVR